MRPMNDRNEAEATQSDDKKQSLERSRYLDLATTKSPFWERVTLGCVELWRLGAERLKLRVDSGSDSVLVPRTTV